MKTLLAAASAAVSPTSVEISRRLYAAAGSALGGVDAVEAALHRRPAARPGGARR